MASAKAKKQKPEETSPSPAPVITTVKAFDADLKCRGFQYEVGKSYSIEGTVTACENGFHACENPLDVLNYYPLIGSRFAFVEQSGAMDRRGDDTKVASATITIKTELRIPDFIRRAVAWIVDSAKDAATTGYRANAATTGNYANAATTGNYANAATTGNYANAATTGNYANAATTGNYANAATTGNYAISASLGVHAKAKAGAGGAICLASRDEITGKLLAIRASRVGENGIKPDVWYALTADGQFVETKVG